MPIYDNTKPISGGYQGRVTQNYQPPAPTSQNTTVTPDANQKATKAYETAKATDAKAQAEFEAKYEKPGTGDSWLSKTDYASLPADDQAIYKSQGYAGVKTKYDTLNAQIDAQNQENAAARTAYDASTASTRARIAELQQEAADATEMMTQGTLNGVYLEPGEVDTNNLKDEIAKATAAANLLQSYVNAQATITPELKALTSPEITPYITANKDGSFNVDVVKAAQLGVSADTLKKLGATDANIAQGQAQASLAKYTVQGGGINLDRAVADNVPVTTLKSAGFTDAAINQSKQTLTTMAVLDKGYKSSGGYNIAQALQDGKVTQPQLVAAGFDPKDIDQAIKPQTITMQTMTTKATSSDVHAAMFNTDRSQTAQQFLDTVVKSTQQGLDAKAAKKTTLTPYEKALAVAQGVSFAEELGIQQAAIKSDKGLLAKLIVKVTGQTIDQVDATPRGVMNFLSIPEIQLVGMGAMGALDQGVILGNKSATAVAKALSSIPKPIQYGAQGAMSGYSGYSTVVNWGNSTLSEKVQGIGFTILPIIPSVIEGIGAMPKNAKISFAYDEANRTVKVANDAAIKLSETPENAKVYTTVRDEAFNARAEALTAQNRLSETLANNGNTKMAKYVKNEVLTKSATDAGIAQRNLAAAKKSLKLTQGTPTYDIAAADAQKAVASARTADKVFTDKIANTDNLTSKQLTNFEKLSGYKGLTESVKDVNTASAQLKDAWDNVDNNRLKVAKGNYVEAKIGSPEYLTNLDRVQSARAKLDAALTRYNDIIQVRTKITPAAGYDGIINQTTSDIQGETVELSRLEAKYNKAISDSMRQQIHEDWLGIQGQLNNDQVKLQLLQSSKDAGVPAPTIQTIFKVKPTSPEMQALVDQINEYNRTHLRESRGGSGGNKPLKQNPNTKTFDGMETQREAAAQESKLATAEKPIELRAPVELTSEERIAAGEQLTEKAIPKSAPKIMEEKGATKLSPLFTRKQQTYEPRQDTKPERLGAMTPEQRAKQSEQTQETTWAVSNTANIVVISPNIIRQEFVTPKGDRLAKISPAAQAKVVDITQSAVDNITNLKNQTPPATNLQIANSTQSLIKDETKTIADTKTRTQVKTQTKTILKTAIALQTRFVTDNKFIPKTIKPSGIALPPLPGRTINDLTPAEKRASVTWKQGIGWWVLPPPYTGKAAIFLIKQPEGIKVSPDLKTARATIQKIKGVKVPNEIDFNRLGIVRAVIRNPSRTAGGNRNAITFSRTGAGQPAAPNNNVRNTRVGNYYVAGGAVSRKPIGKKKRKPSVPWYDE